MREHAIGLIAIGVFRQKSIEIIRERLFVALIKRRRSAAGINATCSHRIEKVSHVESRANVFCCVHFASRAECVTAFVDHFCSKRDVTGDDEVTGI